MVDETENTVIGDRSRKRLERRSGWPVVAAVVLLISSTVVWQYSNIRDAVRWLRWSDAYKAEVLAQPIPADGQLRHIEWDAWGFAGQHNFVFLVFDPTDQLDAAATLSRSGKLPGIPCEVVWVHRLERHWYTARFYTERYWNQCQS